MSRLRGQTAIVTGASAGIGAATARALHAEGARLVLNARRADRLEALAGETDATVVAGDVTEAAVRARILDAAGERVDILVNNAGYGEPGPLETVPDELARRQFEVNVFAPAAMIRDVLPRMRARRAGRIVNVSSIAGRFGYPLFAWYCASKHALEALTDALRLEARLRGVAAVLIEPGPDTTEFFDVVLAREGGKAGDADPWAPFYRHAPDIEREMMKQAIAPEKVARTILRACLVARPRDRYICGTMAKGTNLALRLLPRRWVDAVVTKQFRVPGPADLGNRE